MRRIFIFSLSLFFLGIFTQPAFAHHRERVLGVATPSSEIVFPPVTAGPGFILPDSPFFFLDRLKQTIRLALAFTPEQKARIHEQVAGERMAELRIMLARENLDAIHTDLAELSRELRLAGDDLGVAAASGKQVTQLAREINDTIKTHRKILNRLSDQTSGELELRTLAAQHALKEAKAKVEDSLPQDELENEIAEDLEDEVEDRVSEASESARKVDDALSELRKEASESSQKALKRREKAIKRAIEDRNEVLRRVEEKLLEIEKKKQEKLLEAQEKASEKAREAIKKAEEAAKGLKKAREELDRIRAFPVVEPSGSGGSGQLKIESGGSSGSSSGSSDSNSSGSGESKSGDSGKSGGDSGGSSGSGGSGGGDGHSGKD